eukprot:178668-Rhodomonas_salina.1
MIIGSGRGQTPGLEPLCGCKPALTRAHQVASTLKLPQMKPKHPHSSSRKGGVRRMISRVWSPSHVEFAVEFSDFGIVASSGAGA